MTEPLLSEEDAPVPLAAQIACIKRELALRERCYPRWVAADPPKMTARLAAAELEAMRAVLKTLEYLDDVARRAK